MQTPSQTAEAPTEKRTDAEQKRAGVEVGTYFKKLLDAYRVYQTGHQAFGGMEDMLWTKTRRYLDMFGDLALELSATEISIEGKAVVKASKPEDSVSYPLFAEGVHEILMAKDMERDELFRFIRIWSRAIVEPDPDDTVLTKFWEGDFSNIEMISMGSAGEGGDAESGERRGALRQAMKDVAGELQAFGDNLEAKQYDHSFWSGSGYADEKVAHAGPLRPVADPIAVTLLAAELNLPLTPAHVENPPPPAATRLSAEDLRGLQSVVEGGWKDRVVDRFFTSLFCVVNEASEAEVEALVPAIARVMRAMIDAGQMAAITPVVQRTQQIGAAASKDANRTYALYERLRAAVEDPVVIEPTLAAIQTEEGRDAAISVLQLLRADGVAKLTDGLADLQDPVSIKALIDVIFTKNPSGELLAETARQSKPFIARVLMQKVGGCHVDVATKVRGAVLNHPDARTRLRMVEALQPADVAGSVKELHVLIKDPDKRIREAAIILCVQTRDHGAVPYLVQMLVNDELTPEERARIATAIGRLGGAEAGLALRKAFTKQKDVDIRSACAMALAGMGDQTAKPLIQAEAKKMLAPRKLKSACVEALRRLESGGHRPTTYPPAGPSR